MTEQLPQGFRFASTYAGIRKKRADDLALLISDRPAAAAGVFTQNQVRAAPVELSRKHLEKSGGKARAIVCNAGNANCATPTMNAVARETCQATAKTLGIKTSEVLVCSTGVIGEPLDGSLITAKLESLAAIAEPGGFEAAAKAIMTTDTVQKIATAEVRTAEGTIRIAGMTKGSGMIQPNMATMLGFLFTDAELGPKPLGKMLRTAVNGSFNSISVDSDTSTNDTVFLLANGASGVRPKGIAREAFEKALAKVCEDLAVQIVRDGEGAKKLLRIYVDGAANDREAKKLAREIANSPLVKTALAGADPNWGRILPAAGKAGVKFDPNKVDIYVNGAQVCSRGMRADFSEAEVQKTMEEPESVVRFHLRGKGRGQARFFACDLTEAYIRINAEYRT